MQIKVLSVSEVNSYIKRILTNDPILHNIRVKGEISNLKIHNSGHIYFSLKDSSSKIHCVMFKANSDRVKFTLEEGLKVNIRGYISIYERDGQYQLYVNDIEPQGIGALYLAFQQLKERLEAEGLFDKRYKKELPFLPRRIAIVTSPTGAAIRDIISVIKRRMSKTELIVIPCQVQGEGASASIIKGIKLANALEDIDLIITGRGGGSIEELWAFNEEAVVRAIFESQIPIISAVGHETDFTIADFVADFRAPTPSAAAEIAVPEIREVRELLSTLNKRLCYTMSSNIKDKRNRLELFKHSYSYKYPYANVYDRRQRLERLLEDLNKQIKSRLTISRGQVKAYGERLHGLSPLSVMARGYTIALNDEGKVIKSVLQVKIEDKLSLSMGDGAITCRVIEVVKEDKSLEKEKI